MAYVMGNIPYFGCYVRREYTVNRNGRHQPRAGVPR